MSTDQLRLLKFFGTDSKEPISPYEDFSVRHGIVEYPAFCEAIRKIAHIHGRGKGAKIPTGLLITGQSGSGKTTVLERYCSSFPRHDEGERTVIPVLLVNTPAIPTVKNLAEAILDALGDPLVNKGSAEEKTRRIYRYMVECRVELLIVDEFQHFYDTRRRSEAKQVTDWLKNVLNLAQVPVVIAGLPRASMVIRMNEQLARRFSSGFYLRPFSFDTEARKREFRGLLKLIHSRLPLKCFELHEANMARRFFIASNGLIDYVAKIIDEAVVLAGQQHLAQLDLETFALAFEESVWRDAPPMLNPFSNDSVLRQLDRIGEPFEYWDDPQKYRQGENQLMSKVH